MMKSLILGITAAGALVSLAAPVHAHFATPMPLPEGTRLNIVAMGESRQTPDLVGINAGVVTEAATASAALADNNRRMEAVFRALDAAGIAD